MYLYQPLDSLKIDAGDCYIDNRKLECNKWRRGERRPYISVISTGRVSPYLYRDFFLNDKLVGNWGYTYGWSLLDGKILRVIFHD